MATDWEQYVVNDAAQDSFAKYEVPATEESAAEDSTGTDMAIAIGLGGAAAGGAVGTGVLANKLLIQPMVDSNRAKKELIAMMSQFGIDPKADIERAPKLLDAVRRKAVIDIEKQSKTAESAMNAMRIESSNAIKNLKRVDGNLVASEIAHAIANDFDTINKEASTRYEKLFDTINVKAEQAGFKVHSGNLANSVVDDIISWGEKSGLTDSQMKKIKSVKDRLLGMAEEVDGALRYKALSPSEAKAILFGIIDDPNGKIAAKVRSSFADFLTGNASGDVAGLYRSLQNDYKNFARMRNAVDSVRTAGGYDTTALTRFFASALDKSGDAGQEQILKMLRDGNTVMTGRPDYGNRLDRFMSVKGKISDLISQSQSAAAEIPKMKTMHEMKKLDIEEAFLRWNEKAGVLLDRMGRSPIGQVKKVLGGAMGAGRNVMRAVPGGVIEGKLMEGALGVDPVEALNVWYKGTFGSPEEKRSLEEQSLRKWQERLGI